MNLKITCRPFSESSDLVKILQFLAEVRSSEEICGYFHAGDFIWSSFSPQFEFNLQENIIIWSDTASDDIIGFAWIFPGDYGEYFPRRDVFGTPYEGEMLEWIEAKMLELMAEGESKRFETGGPIIDSPYRINALREATLARAGYERAEDIYVQMEFKGSNRIGDYHLPEGFKISSHGEGLSIEKLIENRPQHEPNKYRQMTQVDGYKSELDLAVVTPSGIVASYCICWYDRYSNSGLFEPVGTLPDFRRMGLAQALMVEGIRRLLKKGAKRIFVCPQEANRAAVKLYESVGFEVIPRAQTWFKTLEK